MDLCILELSIQQAKDGIYQVALRRWHSGHQPDLLISEVPLAFSSEPLNEYEGDEAKYGQALTHMLFANERLIEVWAHAFDTSQIGTSVVRVRIAYSADANELHDVHWELLQDPRADEGVFLSSDEGVRFSRYLTPTDRRQVVPVSTENLRALAVIANPEEGLVRYNLSPIDVSGEVAYIEDAFVGIPVDLLCSGYDDQRVTRAAIEHALRSNPEVLYLAAHGTPKDGDIFVWLEDTDESFDRVSARDLAQIICGRKHVPRLVVLASCHSAGENDNVLAALGPQLVMAGVPAVIAMPGLIAQSTLKRLLPFFFEQLRRTGEVDRALTRARRTIRNDIGWWKPILFLGLHTGTIWAHDRLQSLDASVQGPDARRPFTSSYTRTDLLRQNLQIRIGHDLKVITPLPPVQKQGLTTQVAQVWENLLERQAQVTVVDVAASNSDGKAALNSVLDRIRRHEIAAHHCPYLPRIYCTQQEGTRLWIMQEWVAGTSLRALYPLDESMPSAGSIALMLAQALKVCFALSALHRENLEHGCITPDHIVVPHDHAGQRTRGVILLDTPIDSNGHLTVMQGEAFQAPEQKSLRTKQRSAEPGIDVYGLGATLYTLITHVEPIRPSDHHLKPASTLNPAFPQIGNTMLERALAWEPGDRYGDIQEFARALRALSAALVKR